MYLEALNFKTRLATEFNNHNVELLKLSIVNFKYMKFLPVKVAIAVGDKSFDSIK